MPSTAAVRQACADTLSALWRRGIAAIPLQGKRPSFFLRWKRYQRQLPAWETVQGWLRTGFQSYGILCGAASGGLFALDFDSEERYAAFCQAFPEWRASRTVKTRRGFHVYLQADFAVTPRRFRSCDIQGDGSYVVGPGSLVDGHLYSLQQEAAPKAISYAQFRRILNWLDPSPSAAAARPPATPKENLVEAYKKLAGERGRNNALYAIARQARARGLPLAEALRTLSGAHAKMRCNGFHAFETMQQRLREAGRTIRSAYRAARAPLLENGGLPNAIREALLQKQASSIGARLLDGLWRYRPDAEYLTGRELFEIAKKCSLSKKSLMRALAGGLAKIGRKRLFKRFSFATISQNASEGDNRKPIRKRGRQTQYIYKIPSSSYLCELLQVEMSGGDKLEAADLRSASAYRLALHRGLLRRMQGVLPVEWLAWRLGLHRRSIFRYNRRLNVQIQPTIQRSPWQSAASQPLPTPEKSGFTAGFWLETAAGKRFPALPSIATRLLAAGERGLMLCRQLPSRYILPETVEKAPIPLPKHLKSRAKQLLYEHVARILPPDWAAQKYELGGYLAVYDGSAWVFRPPLRSIAYQLTGRYEAGLVYYIEALKT